MSLRLALVLGVALAARLGLFALAVGDPARMFYHPDSFEYDELADNLAGRGVYARTTDPAAFPELARTPGYPLVVSAVYRAFGHHPALAVLLNVLLGASVPVLTYLLGVRLFGTPAATLAGLIIGLDVASAVYSSLLLSETVFTVVLLLAMIGLPLASATPTMRVALSGLLLGAAALGRPIGMYLPVFLAPVFFVAAGRGEAGRAIRTGLVFAGCALLVVGTWIVRNYVVAGVGELTSLGTVNLLYHRAAPVKAALEGTKLERARKALEETVEETGPKTIPERLRIMKTLARAIIARHWRTYLHLHLLGTARLLGPERDSVYEVLGYLPPDRIEAAGSAGIRPRFPPAALRGAVDLGQWAALGAIYLLALLGSVSALRDGHVPGAALTLLVVAYFLAMSGPETYARFRVPMMPAVALLSGYGAVTLGRWARRCA